MEVADERIRALYPVLPSDYETKQEEASIRCQKFWSGRPCGITLVRDSSLVRFAREGLPDLKRGEMWQLLSGATVLHSLNGPSYYKNLCEAHFNEKSTSLEEIEKVGVASLTLV